MRLIEFEGPFFYSQGDEASFFGWLQNVAGVSEVRGHLTKIGVRIDEGRLTDEAVRELLSVLHRYDVDLRCLRELDTSRYQWLRDENAYWYEPLFGVSG